MNPPCPAHYAGWRVGRPGVPSGGWWQQPAPGQSPDSSAPGIQQPDNKTNYSFFMSKPYKVYFSSNKNIK